MYGLWAWVVLWTKYFAQSTLCQVLCGKYFVPSTLRKVLSAKYFTESTLRKVLCAKYFSAKYFAENTSRKVSCGKYSRQEQGINREKTTGNQDHLWNWATMKIPKSAKFLSPGKFWNRVTAQIFGGLAPPDPPVRTFAEHEQSTTQYMYVLWA